MKRYVYMMSCVGVLGVSSPGWSQPTTAEVRPFETVVEAVLTHEAPSASTAPSSTAPSTTAPSATAPATSESTGGFTRDSSRSPWGPGSSSGSSTSAGDDPMSWKSIFSRDRQPRSTRSFERRDPTPTAPPPPRLPVLVGIVREDDGIVAILEHPSSGRVSQTRLGGELPENFGTLTSMTLDSIEVTPAGGQPFRVSIGQDLRGGSTQLAAAASSTTAPTTSVSGDTGGDDLISRLRRRRLQEMGR